MKVGRLEAVWLLAYAYLVYAAVGDLPQLSSMAAFSIVTSSGLFIVVYFIHSFVNLGPKNAAKYFAVAALLGYGFEYLFINTGWVGHYVYTADLSPFLGPIPAFIPLLWASLGYFCLLASDNIAVSALLMVILDLGFDPRFAVTLWRWVPPGQYFGVPVANFVGWFVTALAIFAVFYLVSRRKQSSSTQAIWFYFLFGLVNSAIPDLVPGLYEAGAISAAVLVAGTALLYLRHLRARKGRPGQRAAPGPAPAGLPESR